MPGPEPAETRRRRNTPEKEKQRVVLPAAGRKGRAPACPSALKLSAESKAQWKSWWSSPMATQWDARFDVFPLARCLDLYDRLRRDPDGLSNGELTEIRHIEARFGLDPKSRRELCWVIEDVDGEDERPKLASVSSADDARRARVAAKASGAG